LIGSTFSIEYSPSLTSKASSKSSYIFCDVLFVLFLATIGSLNFTFIVLIPTTSADVTSGISKSETLNSLLTSVPVMFSSRTNL
jgi:hypothetical protein